MGSRCSRIAGKHHRSAACSVVSTVAVILLCPMSAAAHEVFVFAEVADTTIRGEVSYRGQIPAQGVGVTAFDPAGEPIGEAKTDQQGKFSLNSGRIVFN